MLCTLVVSCGMAVVDFQRLTVSLLLGAGFKPRLHPQSPCINSARYQCATNTVASGDCDNYMRSPLAAPGGFETRAPKAGTVLPPSLSTTGNVEGLRVVSAGLMMSPVDSQSGNLNDGRPAAGPYRP